MDKTKNSIKNIHKEAKKIYFSFVSIENILYIV